MLAPTHAAAAEQAIANAQSTRRRLRRRIRKGSPQRNADINTALAWLAAAMSPIRSFLAETQRDPDAPGRFEALNLSFRLQRERRKLWKLRQAPKHSDV